eukprot:Tbor_TRINITY_DN5572_c0_g2::TRINITY_DN5572_c0_g2_i1::g.13701::m.13701
MRSSLLSGVVRRGSHHSYGSILDAGTTSGMQPTVRLSQSFGRTMSINITNTCVCRNYGSQAPELMNNGMEQPAVCKSRITDGVMTRILTGSNVHEEINILSAREAAHFVRQLTPEPIGPDLYAIACTKLITEAQAAETTEYASSLLKEATGLVFQMPPRFRATAVELTAIRCIEQCRASSLESRKSSRSAPEILEICHEWVKTMRVVDEGGVLRAHLAIAQHIKDTSINDPNSVVNGFVDGQYKDHDIVSSTIDYVMITCRRKRSLAGEVLRPMGKILSCDPSKWVLGVELLDLAQNSGVYFDLNHVDELLMLLSRAGQHNRVLSLWNWLKLTTCAGSKNVISAVVVALTKEKKLNDSFLLVQHLSQKGLVPTVSAQIAILTVISNQEVPMCAYAAELVYFWGPMRITSDLILSPNAISVGSCKESIRNTYMLYYLLFVSYAKARYTEQAAEVLQVFITGVSAKEDADVKDTEVCNDLSMALVREFNDEELARVSQLLHAAVIRGKKTVTVEVVEKAAVSLCQLGERFLECSTPLDTVNMRVKRTGFSLALLSCASSLLDLEVCSLGTSDAANEGVDRLLQSAIESLESLANIEGTDASDVHSDAIRVMFSCLGSECWTDAKKTTKVLSEALNIEMPDDVHQWFSFMSVSEKDDVSSILEELGRD